MEEICIWVNWANKKFQGTTYNYLEDEGLYFESDDFFELVATIQNKLKVFIKFYKEGNDTIVSLKEIGEDLRIIYKFESLQALLKAFMAYFSLAVLSRITHINQTLLYQYASGIKKPRKYQQEKIIAGIKRIGSDLTSFSLVLPGNV